MPYPFAPQSPCTMDRIQLPACTICYPKPTPSRWSIVYLSNVFVCESPDSCLWLYSTASVEEVSKSRRQRYQYGISGAFWYASGATIQILLFSMLVVQLKLYAPGAKTFLQLCRQMWTDCKSSSLFTRPDSIPWTTKTFLQVIRARFGRTTHLTFCVFALLTNVIVTAMLMLGNWIRLNDLERLNAGGKWWNNVTIGTSRLVHHFTIVAAR